MKWIKDNAIVFWLFVALGLTLLAPFLLRPREGRVKSSTERLVIITPHNESIRYEFGLAFSKYMKESQKRDVVIDWRTPGGTSEIVKVLDSEYHASFQNYWGKQGKDNWGQVESSFNNRKLKVNDILKSGGELTLEEEARLTFMKSDVGVGVDLLWGGGAYDFSVQARKGHLVSANADKKFGIEPLSKAKPEWFGEEIIPEDFRGEPFIDKNKKWIGTCLSTFGICYNTDTLKRLGITEPPQQWEDLADPKLIGSVALADPTKSGSVTKAFEMLLQQQIRIAVDRVKSAESIDGYTKKEVENKAIREGWKRGMELIQKITANARYFTDSATKIPLDVAQGDAAVGMCVDFYGRTYNEIHKKVGGSSRIVYITPKGGSSVGVDPIGMLRGAPNPELAHLFIEYVLSKEGQRLWNYRPGIVGGPRKSALRRLPIRRDMYVSSELRSFSDPEERPFGSDNAFIYEPSWTGSAFNSIRYIIKLMAIDYHSEQQEAWRELNKEKSSERALEVFSDLSLVSYEKATKDLAKMLSQGTKRSQIITSRSMGESFKKNYEDAIYLTKKYR